MEGQAARRVGVRRGAVQTPAHPQACFSFTTGWAQDTPFKKGGRRAIYRQDLAGNAGNRARPPPRAAKLRPRAQLGHVHAQSMGHVHAQLSGVGARVAPRRHSVCNLTSLLLPSGAHALGEGLAEEAHTAYMSKRAAR